MNLAKVAPLRPATALRAVYRSEFDSLWRFLLRLGVPRSDIEDVAHEVFVVALRRWDSYQPSRPLRPWLFGIAYRLVADMRRRRKWVAESRSEPTSPATPETEMAAAQARALLLRAMESLELDRRVVFVMHDIDGCSSPDIAGALEIPLNTVYSRLRRAREDLALIVRALRRGEP